MMTCILSLICAIIVVYILYSFKLNFFPDFSIVDFLSCYTMYEPVFWNYLCFVEVKYIQKTCPSCYIVFRRKRTGFLGRTVSHSKLRMLFYLWRKDSLCSFNYILSFIFSKFTFPRRLKREWQNCNFAKLNFLS